MDYETDTEEKGSALNESNDIVVACWLVVRGGEIVKKAHCFGGIYEQQELLDDIASVDFIVAQNLKFELQWTKRCGLELRSVLGYDTMLAEWVVDGNKRNPRNLSALAKKYGVKGKVDLVAKMIENGVKTRDINPRWLLEYCHQDVLTTYHVFLKQQEVITQRSLWHLVHTRNLTCSVLADIEFNGLCLDEERVMEEYARASEIKQRLGAELAEITNGINLGSSKQLTAFLYDVMGFEEAKDYRGKPIRTKKDAQSADSKTLALLKAKTPEQVVFLKLYKEYNKVDSLLSKNLDYFKLVCEQKNGWFYGVLNQNIVQTHRLSSSGRPVIFKGLKKPKSVQLQNMPREYKKLIKAGRAGYKVMGNDSSQVEFRVAVDMSHDIIGTEEVINGVDVHETSARVMTEAGEPTTRQEAKPVTFRPLYGGSSGSKALQDYCQFFKDKYKQISEMQRNWALKCVDKKEFITPYGMTFYFPTAKLQRSGYITDSTNIYNYPVQGFATGEIMPIALVFFWHRTKHLLVDVFNTVHDEIVSRVHEDHVEEAKVIAKQALTLDVYDYLRRVYKYTFSVPLGLGSKVGDHWSEGKEEKLDVFIDGREIAR